MSAAASSANGASNTTGKGAKGAAIEIELAAPPPLGQNVTNARWFRMRSAADGGSIGRPSSDSGFRWNEGCG
jgi:hypothetical protein